MSIVYLLYKGKLPQSLRKALQFSPNTNPWRNAFRKAIKTAVSIPSPDIIK